jgi:hypothetical protein
MMRFFTTGLLISIAIFGNAQTVGAACNEVCQQKCKAGWARGGFSSYDECVSVWSKKNATGQTCWKYSDCVRKCGDSWTSVGFRSADDCVQRHPCSKYPKTC